MRLLGACLALLLASGAYAAPKLRGFDAEYAIHHKGFSVGTLHMSLRHDGGLWRFDSRSEPRGLLAAFSGTRVAEHSVLEPSGAGLRPIAYSYDDGEQDQDRDVSSYFDWRNGLLLSRSGGESMQEPLPAGTYDRLSIILAVSAALAAQPSAVVEVPVAEKGRIRPMQLRSEGSETIRLPYGEVTALRVREVREEGKRHTVSWYAPALDYLLVRMDQYKGGKRAARIELAVLRRGPDREPADPR